MEYWIYFILGGIVGLIYSLIKLYLQKKGLKKREGLGAECVIGIILGLIMAFKGDD